MICVTHQALGLKYGLRSQASTMFYEYHGMLAEKANNPLDSALKAY
jgi:hypothetical protein